MKIRALAFVAALALPTLAIADDKQTPPTPPTDKQQTPPTDKSTEADKPMDKATEKAPGKPDKSAKLSEGDVKILAHLRHVNQMEIQLGKHAQKNGTQAIKGYAETLVQDHQSADKDLMAFAKQRRQAIPADKPQTDAERQEHKDMTQQMARLKTLKGAEFDREFLNMMVSGHDKELTKIDTSIGSASDPDLQTMLKSLKPVLQRHADQARDLQKNVQASLDKPVDDKPIDNKPIDKLPSQR